jgi:3-dehydroquinate dehydratase-1
MTKQSLNKDNFAVVLTGGERKAAVLYAMKDAGWLEFRVDEFLKKFPEKNLASWLSVKGHFKKIGTVRWKKEHQSRGLDIPEKKRLEIYEKIAGYVDYIDVEIRSKIADGVAGIAKKRGKKIIASYHHFSKTPAYDKLERIFCEGKKLHPGIIKIAVSVRSESDLFTLAAFTRRYSGEYPLVVIPMGVPAVERLIPLSFGSLFTYVSIDKQTAPGQITCKTLRTLLRY